MLANILCEISLIGLLLTAAIVLPLAIVPRFVEHPPELLVLALLVRQRCLNLSVLLHSAECRLHLFVAESSATQARRHVEVRLLDISSKRAVVGPTYVAFRPPAIRRLHRRRQRWPPGFATLVNKHFGTKPAHILWRLSSAQIAAVWSNACPNRRLRKIAGG